MRPFSETIAGKEVKVVDGKLLVEKMYAAVELKIAAVSGRAELLDMCTGMGSFLVKLLQYLEKKGITNVNIMATDFNKEMRNSFLQNTPTYLRAKFRLNYLLCNILKHDFRGKRYDVVTSSVGLVEIYEVKGDRAVPRYDALIEKSYRALKPGGLFVATLIEFRKGTESYKRAAEKHFDVLNDKDLIIREILRVGFTIEEIYAMPIEKQKSKTEPEYDGFFKRGEVQRFYLLICRKPSLKL